MTFARVSSTHLAVVPPERVATSLLRRFVATGAETWSEKASRAREFVSYTER